jgi:ParB-like chromosome segregation protein Spo0J
MTEKTDQQSQLGNSQEKHDKDLTKSQRAMLAYEDWDTWKHDKKYRNTHETLAKNYGISTKLIQRTGVVRESASETIQQAIRDGKITVEDACNAITHAIKENRIIDMAYTSPERRKEAFEAQERYLQDKLLSPKPMKQQVAQKLSDDPKKSEWYKGIRKFQSFLSTFQNIHELLEWLHNESVGKERERDTLDFLKNQFHKECEKYLNQRLPNLTSP